MFKSATGITLMLTGFVLSASGFVPNVEQNDTAKLALLTLYAIFPLVCYTVGAVIFNQFKLDETVYKTIRSSLDKGEYLSSEKSVNGDATESDRKPLRSP